MKENNNLDMFKSRLVQLLDNMEVPAMRRDVTKLSNINWLLRNLSINNSGPQVPETLTLLRQERRRLK